MWAGAGKGGGGVRCARQAARGIGLRKQAHGVRDFDIETVMEDVRHCGKLEGPEVSGQDWAYRVRSVRK
jgi:hypothetical protein